MILLWLLVPLLPIVAAIVVYNVANWPAYSNWCVINFIAAVVFVVVLAIPTSRQFDHHYSSAACYRYGAQIDREVRFFTNTFWDYGCYVRTDLGSWVERGKVTETELRGGVRP